MYRMGTVVKKKKSPKENLSEDNEKEPVNASEWARK